MSEEEAPKKAAPEDQEAPEEQPAIPRPATVDPEWDVKIKRAREAWEAGRRLRKNQPAAASVGLFGS
jgi:hypothetical protein